MIKISVPNWSKYNGRQDVRKASWFRLNQDWISSPKASLLDSHDKCVWIYILSECSRKSGGTVNIVPPHVSRTLNLHVDEVLASINKLASQDVEYIKLVCDTDSTAHGQDSTAERRNKTRHNKTRHNTPPTIPPTGEQTNPAPPTLKFTDEHLRLAEKFAKAVSAQNPNCVGLKKLKLEKWADEIRLICSATVKTPAELSEVCRWVFLDGFWRSVIQSPAGLRKNWDKITAKMVAGGRGTAASELEKFNQAVSDGKI